MVGAVSVTAKTDGIYITINSPLQDHQKPEMLLAEKIILLQYGEFVKRDDATVIILPYPNLCGTAPQRTG